GRAALPVRGARSVARCGRRHRWRDLRVHRVRGRPRARIDGLRRLVAVARRRRGVTSGFTGMASESPAPYVFTRFVLLRLLGLVYAVAFLILIQQQDALIGHDGILPA